MLNRQTCKGILCVSPSLITSGVDGIATSLLAPLVRTFQVFVLAFRVEFCVHTEMWHHFIPSSLAPASSSDGISKWSGYSSPSRGDRYSSATAGASCWSSCARWSRTTTSAFVQKTRSISERSSSRLKMAVRVRPEYRGRPFDCSAFRRVVQQPRRDADPSPSTGLSARAPPACPVQLCRPPASASRLPLPPAPLGLPRALLLGMRPHLLFDTPGLPRVLRTSAYILESRPR